MSLFDWIIVLAFNAPIIVYGLIRSKDTKSSSDWFLAGRSLPWWMVGLSLYATAIDSSDLVADAGGNLCPRLHILRDELGWSDGRLGAGGALHFPTDVPGRDVYERRVLGSPLRTGARVLSVFVQVQYRTMVLGIIATTVYLVLAIVCGWGTVAWWAVGAMAAVAAVYTAMGGLKSVAITDALQTIVMVIASLTLFFIVWNAAGGMERVAKQIGLARTGPRASDAARGYRYGRERIHRGEISGRNREPTAARWRV